MTEYYKLALVITQLMCKIGNSLCSLISSLQRLYRNSLRQNFSYFFCLLFDLIHCHSTKCNR